MKFLAFVCIREISNSNLEGITTMLRYLCFFHSQQKTWQSCLFQFIIHSHPDIFSKLSRPSMGTNQPSVRWILGFCSRDKATRSVKLTTRLYHTPKLRKCRAISVLPYAFMVWWTGTTVTFLPSYSTTLKGAINNASFNKTDMFILFIHQE